MSRIESVFDENAESYDSQFSFTWLGNYYRQRTQRVFAAYIPQQASVLELNSGSGEDAVYLVKSGHQVLATDISSRMLACVDKKTSANRLENRLTTRQLDIANLNQLSGQKFDVILSNFGGLNCIKHWSKFAQDARHLLNEQGRMILCLMGPKVPWEWLWFGVRGEFSKAFRRVSGHCEWKGANIYYPSLNEFTAVMQEANFEQLHAEALGVLMPPSYVNAHVSRHQKVYIKIARLEERIANSKLACRLADHYLLVLQKQSEFVGRQ